jgi:hypothetical protein
MLCGVFKAPSPAVRAVRVFFFLSEREDDRYLDVCFGGYNSCDKWDN